MTPINIVWLRRDLRLTDHAALHVAAQESNPTLLLFIFDKKILDSLDSKDKRVSFIYEQLQKINNTLKQHNSSLLIKYGNPKDIWQEVIKDFKVQKVFASRDYEPYAQQRDKTIYNDLKSKNVSFIGVKDQVIFEKNDVLKPDGKPYTVYTPYSKKWRELLTQNDLQPYSNLPAFYLCNFPFVQLEDMGFERVKHSVPDFNISHLETYAKNRDFPSKNGTSQLSTHLRFGTIGIRDVFNRTKNSFKFQNELIWREFFMQILYHYPNVVNQNFKRKYDYVQWQNDEILFKKWCAGETGFPLVDAGMRELNTTGLMHNRVRMVAASFLTKLLLVDWRWGEAYFAGKLLDYELSSNNGNWQWAAGTGCDAAPYFRIFNPESQLKKFDPDLTYINKWIPDYKEGYLKPIIDYKAARERCLRVYQEGLSNSFA